MSPNHFCTAVISPSLSTQSLSSVSCCLETYISLTMLSTVLSLRPKHVQREYLHKLKSLDRTAHNVHLRDVSWVNLLDLAVCIWGT